MKRIRRRFAVLVASAVVAAGVVSSVPSTVGAHMCSVIKVKTLTVKDGGVSCVADAASPPSDHVCPRVTTTQVTVIVCVTIP